MADILITAPLSKQPSEKLDRYVEFARELRSGETLSQILSYKVVRVSDGVDVTSTMIASNPAPQISDSTKVQFRVLDGADGIQYKLTLIVKTNLGPEIESDTPINVREG